MTAPHSRVSPFDAATDAAPDPRMSPLMSAAAEATARAADDPTQGVLVVILQPGSDDAVVISGGGTGVLRAAMSVALAAGNDRLWRDAPSGTTSECTVRNLPEVIAASAEADGVTRIHTGCVRRGEVIDAVTVWFETWNGVAAAADRARTLSALQIAAERTAAIAAQIAPDCDDDRSAESESDGGGPRSWRTDDPTLDPTTGVLTGEAFFDAIDEIESDEATMLLVDLDGFRSVSEIWGGATADAILRTVADRMVGGLGRDDRIGRIGHDRFALLLTAADRSAAMQIGKRIVTDIARPLPDDVGPEQVTATVALAHQIGLVDLEELLESAVAAVTSGKRSGVGRLVLAA